MPNEQQRTDGRPGMDALAMSFAPGRAAVSGRPGVAAAGRGGRLPPVRSAREPRLRAGPPSTVVGERGTVAGHHLGVGRLASIPAIGSRS